MGPQSVFNIDNRFNSGNQLQSVGQSGGTVKNEMTSAGGAGNFEAFLAELKKEIAAIPDANVAQVEQEVIEPLRVIAAEPKPENAEAEVTLRTRIGAIIDKLAPYTPYIRRTIAAFAEGALLASSPLGYVAKIIVAGCVEVVRDARRE